MCGICGALSTDPSGDLLERVKGMSRALYHRGPDSGGHFSHNGAAIAVRRLAIIDLETGDQPIANEDETLHVVLNGEIYNYVELAEELRRLGHRFRTASDTETIVHAYEEYGDRVTEHLRGMFAFAIYDTRDGSVFIARDRFGEKPLFYYQTASTLVFSSEIRSLLEWQDIPRKVDPEALGYYLRVGHTPSPITLLQGVYEVPPGCWLRWHDGQISSGRYHVVDYQPSREFEDESAAVEAVGQVLRTAVQRQMRSDVPLGAFLSGGIDSSTIVALMQSFSTKPIKTYSIQLEDASFDESDVAKAVAEHVGTDHHVIRIGNASFTQDDIWRTVEHVGMPSIDESAIPAYLLSQTAREELTVCLTGDGGDEMFGGYRVFPWGLKVHRLGQIPKPALRATRGAIGVSTRLLRGRGPVVLRQATRALEAAEQQGLDQFVMINAPFQPADVESLVAEPSVLSVARGNLHRLVEVPDTVISWTVLRKLMYYRLKNNLPQIMLVKADRMSMAASLELRAPFLDPDLADLAARLPDKHLLKGNVGKHILRQVARPLLPDSVFSHPKTGFGVPLHRYRNEAYANLAQELLSNRSGPLSLLNSAGIDRIRTLGLSREQDRSDISIYRVSVQLWALVQLAAWSEQFNVGV